MFTEFRARLLLAAAASLIAVPAAAQRAHVHGEAELNLVAEADALYLELIIPAESLVGFERAPRSDAEVTAVTEARARLGDVASLFRVASTCEVAAVELVDPFAPGEHAASHGEHDHDHADHDHHHGDHDHAGHGHSGHHHGDHAHGDHDHQHGTHDHADFVMLVSYACGQAPAGLEVALFEAFPRLERVRAQYVTASGQGAAVLSASNPGLRW